MSFTEQDFESIIVKHLVNVSDYELASNADFDKARAIDEARLFRYIGDTQPDIIKRLDRKNFLDALDKALSDIGIVKLIHDGFRFNGRLIELYSPRASEGNVKTAQLHEKNIFSVARQVHYSQQNPNRSIDIVIFLNGIPIITAELKHSFNGSSVRDAVNQYKTSRNSSERIFQPRRALVHFAVSDDEIAMCTDLSQGRFFPFNKGDSGGSGNPINPRGAKTAYLWEEILTRNMLSNLIENYIQIVGEAQIFPRWHQLRAVEKLIALVKQEGVGHRYLIQHSAGSGKSNSISWLAKQLADITIKGKKLFDSVIVVTDRINLDRQLTKTIRNVSHLSSMIAHAETSNALNNLLDARKSIITTTIQKFPHLVEKLDAGYKDRCFAILIDEAHSSQGGKSAAKMNQAVGGVIADKNADVEDKINAMLEGSRMAKNVSYIAFTATPKAKTLEMFGQQMIGADGITRSMPHDVYSMQQAIEENFILDVLKNYTTYKSYFNLDKKIEGDPLFYKKRALKELRLYLNENATTIAAKAESIVDHFMRNVQSQIGGRARAMVVTDGIKQAVNYYRAIERLLIERNSPYRSIVAFTGKIEIDGEQYDERSLNGFSDIERKIQQEPYRLLIVADKFQTGYDEPLLQTMYVDKVLSGVRAVQTLSRLNRCAPNKREVFVLDFANTTAAIVSAFERYYQTTLMSGVTDAAKLNELVELMYAMKVFTPEELDNVAAAELNRKPEDIYPPIDRSIERFKALNDGEQKQFRAALKNFLKVYSFLSCVVECNGGSEFAKLAMYLDRLKMKLPRGDDEIRAAEEIRKCVDLTSYRAALCQQSEELKLSGGDAKLSAMSIQTELERLNTPELEHLSDILETFRREWRSQFDNDTLDKLSNETRDVIQKIAIDRRYLNAKRYSDAQNARIESDRLVLSLIMNSDELYKAFNSHKQGDWSKQEFRLWLLNYVFQTLYRDGDTFGF